MRKYNNPRLLNTVVAGPGMKHPTKPHVIVGDNGEFIQGDLMDANAVGELVDQKIDDSEEHIIPKIDELSEQLEQEITNREAADEDLSETIDSRIQDVVGAAPEALDTLKELADALNDDANFAATVTNELTELDERVDNNTSGISSLNTAVGNEATRAQGVETALGNRITAIENISIDTLRQAITAETNARVSADNTMQAQVNQVNTSIAGKQDKLLLGTVAGSTEEAVSVAPVANSYVTVTGTVNTLTITLPAVSSLSTEYLDGVVVLFTTGATPNVTIQPASGDAVDIKYFRSFEIAANLGYELNFVWNGACWIVSYGIIE